MSPDRFRSIPLFSELGPGEAQALAELLRAQSLDAGEPLFWIGDAGHEFYVIEHGRIHITFPDHSGREITLATLGPGDFLGEIALLDGGPRTATARAAVKTTLLSLGREDFFNFIRSNPSVAIHIIAILGKRQRDSVDRLRGIRNVNEVVEEQSSRWHRVANSIAGIVSSHWFLITHAILFGSWIVMNLSLGHRGPDPFPFPFLCFWTSCEAIFLSLFILVSQSLQSRKDRIRTEVEYQVALKMQVEIMQLHHKIDQLPQSLFNEARQAAEASTVDQ